MIVLDYKDKRPIYEQVSMKLQNLIVSGALEADTKMPSVRALAVEISVNANTIQKAYAHLESQGYIYPVVGKGNFVSEESSWKDGKLLEVKNDLTISIKNAEKIGMSQEEVLQIIKKIYGGEND